MFAKVLVLALLQIVVGELVPYYYYPRLSKSLNEYANAGQGANSNNDWLYGASVGEADTRVFEYSNDKGQQSSDKQDRIRSFTKGGVYEKLNTDARKNDIDKTKILQKSDARKLAASNAGDKSSASWYQNVGVGANEQDLWEY